MFHGSIRKEIKRKLVERSSHHAGFYGVASVSGKYGRTSVYRWNRPKLANGSFASCVLNLVCHLK
jgi:hypothetical protein